MNMNNCKNSEYLKKTNNYLPKKSPGICLPIFTMVTHQKYAHLVTLRQIDQAASHSQPTSVQWVRLPKNIEYLVRDKNSFLSQFR